VWGLRELDHASGGWMGGDEGFPPWLMGEVLARDREAEILNLLHGCLDVGNGEGQVVRSLAETFQELGHETRPVGIEQFEESAVLGGPEVEGQVAELRECFTEDGGCSVIAAQALGGGQRIVRAEGDVVQVDHETERN